MNDVEVAEAQDGITEEPTIMGLDVYEESRKASKKRGRQIVLYIPVITLFIFYVLAAAGFVTSILVCVFFIVIGILVMFYGVTVVHESSRIGVLMILSSFCYTIVGVVFIWVETRVQLDWIILGMGITLALLIPIGFDSSPVPKRLFWYFILSEVILVTWFFIEFNNQIGLSQIMIELAGAFLGVLGALVITNVLEDVKESGEMKMLRLDIQNELQRIHKFILEKSERRILLPAWTSMLAGGNFGKLKREERTKITEAYREIQLYDNRESTKEKVLSKIEAVFD